MRQYFACVLIATLCVGELETDYEKIACAAIEKKRREAFAECLCVRKIRMAHDKKLSYHIEICCGNT